MTEIVSDDERFGESPASSPVPSVLSLVHSPVAGGRSGRSSASSALDLGKMTNLSRSYLMTPDESLRPYHGDEFSRSHLDDDALNGTAHDDDDDLLNSLGQSIGGHVEDEQDSVVDSIHSESGNQADDDDLLTEGISAVETVPPESFVDQQPLERRLDTIAEETRSHILTTELSPAEKSVASFGARGPGEFSWNASQPSISSDEFQRSVNALDLMNEAEKECVTGNQFIQEDARFQNSHNAAEHSWDVSVTSPTPVSIPLPRPSQTASPPASSTFTVDSQRRRSRKEQKDHERSQRMEKQPPAVHCEESTPFLDCTDDVGLTQLPLISTPNGATSASNQSSLRLRQRQRSNLSDAFHSISQLSDTVSPIGASNSAPRNEHAAEASILNGISNLHLTTASPTALSSSAIQRCLLNESSSAEASKLALAILHANQTLTNSARDRASRQADNCPRSSSAGTGTRKPSTNERSSHSDSGSIRGEATSSVKPVDLIHSMRNAHLEERSGRGRTALSDTNSRQLSTSGRNMETSLSGSLNANSRQTVAAPPSMDSFSSRSSSMEAEERRHSSRRALTDTNSRHLSPNEAYPSSKANTLTAYPYEMSAEMRDLHKSAQLEAVNRRSRCKTPLSSSGVNSRDTSFRMTDFDSRKSSMEDLTVAGVGKTTMTSSRADGQSANSTLTSSRAVGQSASSTLTPATRTAEKRPASTSSSISGDDLRSPLRTNRTRMYFGFVDIGDRVVQSVQLRNQSTAPLRIRCEILRPNKGFELTDKESIILIAPDELVSVRVSFLPTQIASYSNTLKFYIINSALKFTQVLHGIGGCAAVSMERHENVTVLRDGTYVLETSRVGTLPLKLTNRGPRDAFVRVLVAEKTALDSPLEGSFVTPTDSVVIRAGDTRELTVSMPDLSQFGRLSSLSQASSNDSTRLRVLLLWGEEKQRQRLKRYEQVRNTKMPFEGRSFTTERFCGEENVSSLPEDTGVSRLDYDVFLSSLRRTVIKVFNNRLSLAGSVVSSSVGDRSAIATSFALYDPDSSSASGVGHVLGSTVVPDSSNLFSPPPASSSRSPVAPKRSRICHSPPERERGTDKSNNTPGVQTKEKTLKFADTRVDAWDSDKVELRNVSPKSNTMTLWTEGNAFSVKMTQYIIDAMKFVKIPVYFRPTITGLHQGKLFISLEDGKVLTVQLEGFAIL